MVILSSLCVELKRERVANALNTKNVTSSALHVSSSKKFIALFLTSYFLFLSSLIVAEFLTETEYV